MTSAEIKSAVLWHMLYRLGFLAAVTEYGNKGCDGIADLFGINKSDYTHEFEVKVSRADLMGEINAMKFHLSERLQQPELPRLYPTMPQSERVDKYRKSAKKGTKHWGYLCQTVGGNDPFHPKPNRFSFAVPTELADFALSQLKDSPYGLLSVRDNYDVITRKKADYLHKDKVSNEIVRKLLHKSSTEIQSIRAELIVSKQNYKSAVARLPK